MSSGSVRKKEKTSRTSASGSRMGTRKKILTTLLFAAALLLVLYPFFANIWNTHVQQLRVVEYNETASAVGEDVYAEYIEAAQAWNAGEYTAGAGLSDEEIYASLLNITGDGMMGYVEIPAIDVKLPIYHDTTDEVLQQGAGHLSTSALPVGGEGTRCVLMAHRGLPSAEMFLYLDEVETGDVFYLRVLNETFAYEVTDITVAEPDEVSDLVLPVSGEDLCTLVTCTPYGINSHRLLVTGTRTEYDGSDAAETAAPSAARTAAGHWYLLLIAALEAAVYLYLMRRSG